MENRAEIKEGVKNKLIEKLADQIAQESDFELLKKELSAELFELKQETNKDSINEINDVVVEGVPKIKRDLDENDGLTPETIKEEIFKELNGFVFDPTPIEDRFEGGVDKLQGRSSNFGPVSLLEHMDEIGTIDKPKSPVRSSLEEIAERMAALKNSSILSGEVDALNKIYKIKEEAINYNPYFDKSKNLIIKLDDETKPADINNKDTLSTTVDKKEFSLSGVSLSGVSLYDTTENPKDIKREKSKRIIIKSKKRVTKIQNKKKPTLKKKRG